MAVKRQSIEEQYYRQKITPVVDKIEALLDKRFFEFYDGEQASIPISVIGSTNGDPLNISNERVFQALAHRYYLAGWTMTLKQVKGQEFLLFVPYVNTDTDD